MAEKATDVVVPENETTTADEKAVTTAPVLNAEALVARLETFEGEMKLTGEYFNPEEGEITKCWYIGNTSMNAIDGEGKIEAVRLLLDDKSIAVTASAIIVGTLSDLPIPSPVKIVKTGERKLQGGRVLKEYDVSLLQ